MQPPPPPLRLLYPSIEIDVEFILKSAGASVENWKVWKPIA